jgi:hypothetical protein
MSCRASEAFYAEVPDVAHQAAIREVLERSLAEFRWLSLGY